MHDMTPKELEAHLEGNGKVFLKLWKRGCGACKLSIPAVERLEKADVHGLLFGQINVDEYPEMLEIAEAEMLPAFFVFANRKMAGKFLGFKGLEKLKAMVEEALQPTSE